MCPRIMIRRLFLKNSTSVLFILHTYRTEHTLMKTIKVA